MRPSAMTEKEEINGNVPSCTRSTHHVKVLARSWILNSRCELSHECPQNRDDRHSTYTTTIYAKISVTLQQTQKQSPLTER